MSYKIKHTPHPTEPDLDVSSATAITPDHPNGLMQIPAELRNGIYDYATPDLTELVIPEHFEGSAFDFLSQRLDPGLRLNHQIFEEAAMAYFRRTLLTITGLRVPNPQTLASHLPPDMVFKKVRHLEFNSPQGHPPDPLSPSTTPIGVHDVLSRCPEARSLTVSVTAGMLVTTDKQPGQLRLKTMDEIEALMRFDRMLEFKHLHTLQFICIDSEKFANLVGRVCSNIFDDFAEWMWQKFVDKGRQISFNIQIRPESMRGYNHYELGWIKRDLVTYYIFQDFFG